MNNIQIKVKKLKEGAVMPTRGTEYAAGSDLYACIDSPIVIAPHETVMIGTGLAMEIPAGYAGLIYPRSGIASKRGLAPANKVGVVQQAQNLSTRRCMGAAKDTVLSEGTDNSCPGRLSCIFIRHGISLCRP